ncbi:class I SAM-dependent methyltransferase [Caenimonas sedimenti]|uniref:Class I SAM-dependent methyltransferase n=1 Tax=Caenimonas sedimenti TaxID=2596921 RepID=A0A562ZFQ1_9BURK|nr:cyclopropane-fatty-acyl-phospholipid synthase family protein [Caenimonas sedimenti]TWO66627.1 class I SAM-dependent methyltransferase [Caenimonas sedimenti]
MTTTTAGGLGWKARAPATAHAALKLLEQLRHGCLFVEFPDGQAARFGHGEPHASLHLANWKPFTQALASGDIGFAESYVAGDWTTPDLPGLLALLVRNRQALEDVVYGTWWGRLAYRLKHLVQRNSRAGSRKNIHAHYDLGNAFYRLWLDETMNYSSALFEGDAGRTMVQAQHAKVRRALQAAQVRPGARVLEIGCGWGALAEMAAVEFGADVTGVTLSTEQLAFARERVPAADLRLQDYRDIGDAPFDAICSIEMVEAVGREYWPQYFATVARLLKPGGRACVQSIVIDDALWPRYVRSTDFIQQYIFPGGCLPCPAEFRRAAAAAGLTVVDEFAFGLDYAATLAHWRERFLAQRGAVLALGFDERFIRLWEFYLAYCEAAFRQRDVDVVQYTLQRA